MIGKKSKPSLENQAINCIIEGQLKNSICSHYTIPRTLFSIGFSLLGIAVFINFFLSLVHLLGFGGNRLAEFFLYFTDKAPLYLSPLFLYFGAIIYTQWRQPREISFEMVKELHSKEFHEIRFTVIERAKSADGINDIDDIKGWMPHETYAYFEKTRKITEVGLPKAAKMPVRIYQPTGSNYEERFEKWLKEHALTRLGYFMFRIYVADKHGLIERSVTRQLFHFFFSHYELLMLEMAYAMKLHINEYRKSVAAYDRRWEDFADGIIGFFPIVGLSGKLPAEHQFYFFPSANRE